MIRQPISIFLLRFVAPLLASLAFAAHPAAQISLSGSVFDGSGGPLLTGQIYHLTGNVTVPTGQTLTVQAGAIVKSPSFQISVAGSMIVQGTALDPAIFTSLEDDSAGGDSNGNGPSSGSPGDWVGISVNSSGTLMADHMVVRYAGMGSAGGLNNQGVLSLSNSTVQDSLFTGLRLNMSQSILGVTGCTFQDNGSYAVEGVRLDVVPAFSNNTASGNGLGDYMRIQHAMPAMDTTITTANLIGGVAVITANSTIPSGVTLRMEAGVVVKWAGNLRQTVDGTLELAGTVANPVVYTVLEDDDYGGDTNKDGPSSGVPGAWQGILNNNGGAVNANESILRYAGSGFLGAIQSTGVLTLTNSTLSDSFTTPLKLALSAQVPIVTNCSFENNGGYAVDGARLDVLPGFSNNTAMGNSMGDYIRVMQAQPTADLTIGPDNLLGNVLVITVNSTVPAGVTLRIEAGVVVKWAGNLRQTVDGTLELAGTEANPVIYTVLDDDDFGGDTNNNGPSNGAPGTWQGILNDPSGTVTAEWFTLRYGGSGFFGGIHNNGVLSLANSTLRDCSQSGLMLNSSVTVPAVSGCRFENNGTYAVDGARLDVLSGFSGNTASGNTSGDYIRVTQAQPSSDTTISRSNLLGNTLVITTTATVPVGVTLCLERGVIVKWSGNARLNVSGALLAKGTAFDPVVFTELDDDYGGDTNKNGSATTGSPGAWQGIHFLAGSLPCLLENVRVRYCGASFFPGVFCQSSPVTLRSVRVDNSAWDGFDLGALSGDATNLVAFGCSGVGIDLTGGAFDVIHATCSSNSGGGIRTAAAHSGRAINSISWANGTGNFLGFAPGEILSSNGDPASAGSDGNIDLDPLFTDPSASVGDLTLQAASPCIDAGNDLLGAGVAKDHCENSRRLDPTLSGNARSDMGAHEHTLWTMVRLSEDLTLGGKVRLRVTGPAGSSLYLLGLLHGSSFQNPYGFLTAGTAGLHMLGVVPVGAAYSVAVPNRLSLVGASFGVQTLTTAAGSPSRGAYTNLYRAVVGNARPGDRGKIAFVGGPPQTP